MIIWIMTILIEVKSDPSPIIWEEQGIVLNPAGLVALPSEDMQLSLMINIRKPILIQVDNCDIGCTKNNLTKEELYKTCEQPIEVTGNYSRIYPAYQNEEMKHKESEKVIEVGMSVSEVEEIMGSPSEVISEGKDLKNQLWIYKYENGNEVLLTFIKYKLFRIEEK